MHMDYLGVKNVMQTAYGLSCCKECDEINNCAYGLAWCKECNAINNCTFSGCNQYLHLGHSYSSVGQDV